MDALTISCLLLASKFNEIDDNIPLIEEFCKGHGLVRDSLASGHLLAHETHRPQLQGLSRTYPGYHAVRRCETYLLGVLSWDLNSVTPLHFVENFLYQGATVFSNDDIINKADEGSEVSEALIKVRRHVDYFALLALR